MVIHGLTYFGIDPRVHVRALWYTLQLTSAIGFLLTLLVSRRVNSHDSNATTVVNTILIVGFGITLAYAIFNFFFTGIALNHGSYPDVINGRYVLTSHGAFHEIGHADFLRYKAYEARMWSGHWMTFYLLTASDLYHRMRKQPGYRRHRLLRANIGGK
jgi:hypothetical protein